MQVRGEEDLGHFLSLHKNPADFPLEASDVPSHAVLGARSIPCQDGPEEIDVLGDRLAQPHLLVDDEVPEPEAEVEVSLERAFEKRVAGRSVDLAVDPL